MKKLLAVLVLGVLAACQSSSPVAPTETKTAPTQVSTSRYILISGVWTCVEGCEEDAN
jgi:hypothetical protein